MTVVRNKHSLTLLNVTSLAREVLAERLAGAGGCHHEYWKTSPVFMMKDDPGLWKKSNQ